MSTKGLPITFYTGWLFVFNIAWAWRNGVFDICFGAALCLFTTIANHATACRYKIINRVDQLVVNFGTSACNYSLISFVTIVCCIWCWRLLFAVGLWFLCYGWWSLPLFYYATSLVLATIAMTLYLRVSVPHNHWVAHAFVHILANVGVGIYLAGAIAAGAEYSDAFFRIPWPVTMPQWLGLQEVFSRGWIDIVFWPNHFFFAQCMLEPCLAPLFYGLYNYTYV